MNSIKSPVRKRPAHMTRNRIRFENILYEKKEKVLSSCKKIEFFVLLLIFQESVSNLSVLQEQEIYHYESNVCSFFYI